MTQAVSKWTSKQLSQPEQPFSCVKTLWLSVQARFEGKPAKSRQWRTERTSWLPDQRKWHSQSILLHPLCILRWRDRCYVRKDNKTLWENCSSFLQQLFIFACNVNRIAGPFFNVAATSVQAEHGVRPSLEAFISSPFAARFSTFNKHMRFKLKLLQQNIFSKPP